MYIGMYRVFDREKAEIKLGSGGRLSDTIWRKVFRDVLEIFSKFWIGKGKLLE